MYRTLRVRLPRTLHGCQTYPDEVAGAPHVCEIPAVDAAAHYRQLLQLGKDKFLAAAAPAALVRYRGAGDARAAANMPSTLSVEQEIEETLEHGRVELDDVELQVFPLTKKPGASFPDRITIGRTINNDVVLADTSISRLHAYVRRDGSAWVVADAGSKNGSSLRGIALPARKETAMPSRAQLRFGDVELTFFEARDLYNALGGTA
jgi:hypothetical protein